MRRDDPFWARNPVTRLDHARAASRDRMRSQGVDNIADFSMPGGLTPPRPRKSKSDLRRELEAATAKISRVIECGCGHSAAVALPPSRANARLKCSRCGSIAEAEKGKARRG